MRAICWVEGVLLVDYEEDDLNLRSIIDIFYYIV
jgi:hypothetical protein